MIRLNDHYFISWLMVVKKYEIKISDKKIYVNMTSQQYTDALDEYKSNCGPVMKEIRKNVKRLASLTSKQL